MHAYIVLCLATGSAQREAARCARTRGPGRRPGRRPARPGHMAVWRSIRSAGTPRPKHRPDPRLAQMAVTALRAWITALARRAARPRAGSQRRRDWSFSTRPGAAAGRGNVRREFATCTKARSRDDWTPRELRNSFDLSPPLRRTRRGNRPPGRAASTRAAGWSTGANCRPVDDHRRRSMDKFFPGTTRSRRTSRWAFTGTPKPTSTRACHSRRPAARTCC